MSVRRVAVTVVPAAAPANLVSHEDRLKASFFSLPRPKDTKAGYYEDDERAAGWKKEGDSSRFLAAYTAALNKHTDALGLKMAFKAKMAYIINMRAMYRQPGFRDMLRQKSVFQEQWITFQIEDRMNKLPPSNPGHLDPMNPQQMYATIDNYLAALEIVAWHNVPF